MPKHTRITRIAGEVNGQPFDVDLAALAAITNNVEGLNQALAEHPGSFAWWATLETLAKAEVDRQVEDLRFYEGQCIDSLIRQHEEEKRRVPAVSRLKQIVALSEEHHQRIKTLREARRKFRLIQIGRKVVQEKKASVMGLAQLLAKEMESQMRPRATDAAKARMESAFGPEPTPPQRRRA